MRDQLLSAGADPDVVAQDAYDGVMATAFDPNTKTQNIRYDALEADPGNPALQHTVLMQELVGAADLLSLTHIRGPIGSVENVVEVLASHASGQALQEVLQARGITTDGVADMGQLKALRNLANRVCMSYGSIVTLIRGSLLVYYSDDSLPSNRLSLQLV